MTKEQIKDLISAKIAGQGTNVDAGGALAQILDEIVDAIPSPAPIVDLGELSQSVTPLSDELGSKIVKSVGIIVGSNFYPNLTGGLISAKTFSDDLPPSTQQMPIVSVFGDLIFDPDGYYISSASIFYLLKDGTGYFIESCEL